MVKGYIFDYGGTLDTGGNHWGKVIWHAYERVGVPVDEALFREAYVHGEDVVSIADLDVDEKLLRTASEEPVDSDEYVFLSGEELEELIQKRKGKLNEKENNRQQ